MAAPTGVGLLSSGTATAAQGGISEAHGLPLAAGEHAKFRSSSSVLTVYGPFNVRA
jgi:hypothetical protein